VHVSLYEADAYAQWLRRTVPGARLPFEGEWEHAAADAAADDEPALHPRAAEDGGMTQLFGACWQWTASSYAPYPGFAPAAGAIGEYNGKFMVNQYVLRGSSCATPPATAARATAISSRRTRAGSSAASASRAACRVGYSFDPMRSKRCRFIQISEALPTMFASGTKPL
jgi:formylglycine-generating enzyme required for sulfatase activity